MRKNKLKYTIVGGFVIIAISLLHVKGIRLGCIPVAYPVTLLRITVVIIDATCDSPFVR